MAGTALVVEDHPLYRDALTLVLRQIFGASGVATASSAEEGLRVAQQSGDLALILLDPGLPGMKGIEALAAFRKLRPNVPVIAISASEDRRDVEAALRRRDRFRVEGVVHGSGVRPGAQGMRRRSGRAAVDQRLRPRRDRGRAGARADPAAARDPGSPVPGASEQGDRAAPRAGRGDGEDACVPRSSRCSASPTARRRCWKRAAAGCCPSRRRRSRESGNP